MGCYKVPSAPLTSPLTREKKRRNRMKPKKPAETKPTEIKPPLRKPRGPIDVKPWKPTTIKAVNFIHLARPRVQFEVPHEGISGQFLEYHFSGMFLEVYDLVKTVFGGDGHLKAETSPWANHYSEDFYQHAKAVARPDPHSQHWEDLLRNGVERNFLLCAIILRILDANVFSSLMFGASNEHEAQLRAEDISMLDREGLQRNLTLSNINKAYLTDNRGVPPHFWDQVQRVTSQITCMLLPLYNLVGQESSDGMPSLEDFAQSLLDIVTTAGWLSVMIRLSPGILTIDWTPPGDDYEISQVNMLHEIYELSKLNAEYDDEQLGKPKPERTARVMISVAPAVEYICQQHDLQPRGSRFFQSYHNLHGKDLRITYKVLRPHVLYYSGMSNSRQDELAVYPLSKYIDDMRWQSWKKMPVLSQTILRIVFLTCILWILTRFSQSADRIMRRVLTLM